MIFRIKAVITSATLCCFRNMVDRMMDTVRTRMEAEHTLLFLHRLFWSRATHAAVALNTCILGKIFVGVSILYRNCPPE